MSMIIIEYMCACIYLSDRHVMQISHDCWFNWSCHIRTHLLSRSNLSLGWTGFLAFFQEVIITRLGSLPSNVSMKVLFLQVLTTVKHLYLAVTLFW